MEIIENLIAQALKRVNYSIDQRVRDILNQDRHEAQNRLFTDYLLGGQFGLKRARVNIIADKVICEAYAII